MPTMKAKVISLDRASLRKLAASKGASALQRELAGLRLAYSEDHKLLSGYINRLIGTEHIYPRHYPGQASGRTSTIDPPITNWPRECINQDCPRGEHEWEARCWSLRDIQKPGDDSILVSHDHDNIEGRIHDLIVNDAEALEAHREGYDLHTITCCNIFGYSMPTNLRNPHSSLEDTEWRAAYHWQGKDTRQRVLAKNFNHGSKYARNEFFVHKIPGIEAYGVAYSDLRKLAKKYIETKGQIWLRKLAIMDHIRHTRVARTLYGFRRMFFDSSEETGKEGFSHIISGTVSDYNNLSIKLIHDWIGGDVTLAHNAHDGDKFFVKRDWIREHYAGDLKAFTDDYKALIERPIEFGGRSITLTAGVKVSKW